MPQVDQCTPAKGLTGAGLLTGRRSGVASLEARACNRAVRPTVRTAVRSVHVAGTVTGSVYRFQCACTPSSRYTRATAGDIGGTASTGSCANSVARRLRVWVGASPAGCRLAKSAGPARLRTAPDRRFERTQRLVRSAHALDLHDDRDRHRIRSRHDRDRRGVSAHDQPRRFTVTVRVPRPVAGSDAAPTVSQLASSDTDETLRLPPPPLTSESDALVPCVPKLRPLGVATS